jgi:type VI secretion system secreted protein VgrG
VIKTDASVSTLAANKIMYEVPEVVFGQVIDAGGNASAVTTVPFDIKKTQGAVVSAPGTFVPPTAYLAAASSAAIGAATKVFYKKGVVTEIEGVEKLTVHQNQIVEIKGNAAKNIAGTYNETVQGDMTIYSPSQITIKSDSLVNIDTPWAVETKWNTTSFAASNISTTGVAFGFTGFNFGVTASKMENNPITILYNRGFKFKVAGADVTTAKAAFRSAIIHMFN